MKKVKKYNIIFFLVVFIILLFTALSKPLNDLDEMWNYNIARNIANGLVPYKDISMITSPLLGMITAVFLKLIANELIVTRILSAVLSTLILYFLYKTMNILKFNENVSHLIIVIFLIILRKLFCLDYNWAVALVQIIILNLELINIEKRKNNNNKSNLKYEFLIGCLAGIAICFKQSIGGLIAIMSIIYNLIFIKQKSDFKEYIKNSLIRIFGIVLPVFILTIYLLYNNALYEFVDYCILGIKTFSNSMSYIDLIKEENIFLKITLILIPIMYLGISIKIIFDVLKGKDIKILFTMLGYSIALFAITFPIANKIHFLIGTLTSMILLAYSIYLIIKRYFTKKIIISDKIIKVFISIFLLAILIYTLSKYIAIYKEYGLSEDLKHFKYIPILEVLEDSIKNIDNYFLSCKSKVYMLDSNAVVYMIPMDRYNKDYDMFNIGNFGEKGENGKIEDLKNEDDIIVLLRNNEFPMHWQHPLKVRKYIEDNWIKIDTIEMYDVYKKGD